MTAAAYRKETMTEEEKFYVGIPSGETKEVTLGDLPAGVQESIKRMKKDGLTFTVGWPNESEEHVVTSINWSPGDPNPLAEAIIRECTREINLRLDGKLYTVSPVEKS